MTGIVSAVRSPNDLVLRSSRLKSVQTAAVCTLTATAVCRLQEQRVAGMSVAGPFSWERFVCLPAYPFLQCDLHSMAVLVKHFTAWFTYIMWDFNIQFRIKAISLSGPNLISTQCLFYHIYEPGSCRAMLRQIQSLMLREIILAAPCRRQNEQIRKCTHGMTVKTHSFVCVCVCVFFIVLKTLKLMENVYGS